MARSLATFVKLPFDEFISMHLFVYANDAEIVKSQIWKYGSQFHEWHLLQVNLVDIWDQGK